MMVSNITKVGFIVIVLSFIIGISVLVLPLPFFSETHTNTTPSEVIPVDGSYIDIPIIEGKQHPFFMQISIELIIKAPSSGDYYHTSGQIIYSNSKGINGSVPYTDGSWGVSGNEDLHISHTFVIASKYSSTSFSLYARFQGDPVTDGTNDFYVESVNVKINYLMLMSVLPFLCFILGIVLVIAGIIAGKIRPSKKPIIKTVDVGWEPSLQWRGSGGGEDAAKAPKMAIKAPVKKKVKTKKVVKKAVPKGDLQRGCKFCGKPVSRSAFFCPHCYGKLQ